MTLPASSKLNRRAARRKGERPRLCIVSAMIGRHPGHITTQGQILSDLFQEAGYSVIAISTHLNRCLRLADIVDTLLRRRNEFDLLMIDVFSGNSFIGEDLASGLGRQIKRPIVMTLHGGALPDFLARFPGWSQRVLNRATTIITPSQYLARAVLPYGYEAQVIPNTIDLASYPYRHRDAVEPRLFWMRSFHPIYNPVMALRVLQRLLAKYPGATLVMAGQDKNYEREVRKAAADLGVQNAVRFVGFLDMDGKRREAQAADIFINTNRIDNMPVAVIEACAMGLPIVATTVGGLPDLITEGDTGLLVPDGDDCAMYHKIDLLINQPPLSARLSTGGRQLAEQSAWENVRPKWETVFEQALMSVRRIS